jgi:hypothetical protein
MLDLGAASGTIAAGFSDRIQMAYLWLFHAVYLPFLDTNEVRSDRWSI